MQTNTIRPSTTPSTRKPQDPKLGELRHLRMHSCVQAFTLALRSPGVARNYARIASACSDVMRRN